jgi:hypothetical protein
MELYSVYLKAIVMELKLIRMLEGNCDGTEVGIFEGNCDGTEVDKNA